MCGTLFRTLKASEWTSEFLLSSSTGGEMGSEAESEAGSDGLCAISDRMVKRSPLTFGYKPKFSGWLSLEAMWDRTSQAEEQEMQRPWGSRRRVVLWSKPGVSVLEPSALGRGGRRHQKGVQSQVKQGSIGHCKDLTFSLRDIGGHWRDEVKARHNLIYISKGSFWFLFGA